MIFYRKCFACGENGLICETSRDDWKEEYGFFCTHCKKRWKMDSSQVWDLIHASFKEGE